MASERPVPKQSRASWKHLFAFTQTRHCCALVPAILSSCAVAGFRTSLALAMGLFFQIAADYALGDVSAPDTLVEGTNLCILLCGLGAGHWLANTVFLSSWVIFGELQARSVREQMFSSLLAKKMAWYDSQEDGISSFLVRIETQTRELQLATSQVFGFIASDLAVSIACLALSFYMSWRLTLVLLATVPISFLILAWVSRPLEPAIRAQKRHLAEASKYTNSSFTGIDLVKVYNGFDQEIWQYTQAIKAAMKQYLTQARCNSMQMGYAKFWIVSLFVVGFWYGLVLVDQGATPLQILTTFYATLTALQGIEDLMPQWLVLAKGMSAGQALRETVKSVSKDWDGSDSGGSEKPRECVGDIEVNDATFAYPSSPNTLVLQKSSFFFPAGETCFIVGRSGSGKSTLGNLLVKFYEPLSGEILVDNRPLKTLDDQWVRQNITLIQQSNILFKDTFFKNVALGHEDPDIATEKEVREACDSAMLHTTLAALPQGLNTMLGSGGYSLSGGQKQRLALARARLRDPPVLILDEVTSGLDHVSKTLVMEAIRIWRKGKTTIIITHDLTPIQDNDYVFVMDKSRLVQEGFRSSLAKEESGFFSSLLAASQDINDADGGMSPISDDEKSPDSPVMRRGSFKNARFSDILTKACVPFDTSATQGRQHYPSIFHNGSFRASLVQSQGLSIAQESRPHRHRRGSSWDAGSPVDHKPRRRHSFAHSEGDTSQRTSIDVVRLAGQSTQALRTGGLRSSQFLESPTKVGGFVDLNEKMVAPDGPSAPIKKSESAAPVAFKEIVRSVWKHLSHVDRLRFLAGVALCIVVAIAGPVFSYVFAGLLAAFWAEAESRESAGEKWAIILLAVSVIDGLATGFGRYLMEHAGQTWVNNLRLEALKRILQQPKPWFDKSKNSAGRINECMDRNAEEMRNLVGRFASIVIIVFFMVSAAVVWALIINWKLTLVALAGVPIIVAAVQAFSYTSTKWETNCNKGAADTSAVMTETFTSIRAVKSLTLEAYMGKKYDASVSSTFKLGMKRAMYTAPIFGVYQSLNFFLLALIFYYAMLLVAKHFEMSPVQFQQVTNLLVFSLGQAASLLGTVPQISAARATAGQMLGYASLSDCSDSSACEGIEAGNLQKVTTPLPIRASGLEFAYPSRPDNKVLRSLSLEINPDTCTAIVGSSGCGKSTFISLLMSLYSPCPPPMLWSDKPPQLTFSGIPFWEIDKQHLRSCMAFVPQAAFLFPATVGENISYGLPETSTMRNAENIQRAAEAAGIHDFISSLADGYNTIIGEGGQALSGGQAQRVCIARALARRPKLLIMDEPTSALDAETADTVRQTIKKLVTDPSHRGMATVIVTHSKEMMQLAERVVVLDGGRVVEEGSYKELRGRAGALSRLLGSV